MAEYRPATVGEALAEYYDDLRLADKAAGTISAYGYQLNRIDPALPLAAFDRALCRRIMLAAMQTQKPNTVRTLHGILSGFASWAVERGYAPVSPMSGVPKPRSPERRPGALSDAQLAAVRDACKSDRERLILALLCGTGLRRAELGSARWEDVEWQRRALTVTGKGRKRRVVLLPQDALPMLEEMRRPSGPIIGLSGNAIWVIIKRIGARAGLPWLHPHSLRHTYATNWLMKGGSAFHLQTIGGWADQQLIRSVYGKAAVEQAALDEAARLFDRDSEAAPG